MMIYNDFESINSRSLREMRILRNRLSRELIVRNISSETEIDGRKRKLRYDVYPLTLFREILESIVR